MNIDEIRAAAARIDGHLTRTPLLYAPGLDALAGRRVFVKAECLQITGSFKARGGWSALSAMSDEQRARGVIAYSSGNHAQGVAYAAQQYGAPALIVMPRDAPVAKVRGTKGYGAQVQLYDRATEDRATIGAALAQERGLTLIKPYDEPMVIAGQGTCGLEIARQAAAHGLDEADVLVCCGGGGLAAGIALALEAEAPGLRVRPVEPEGFDDVKRSLESGNIEKNVAPTGSICDAIVTPSPGEVTFPILKRLAGPGIAVPDEDARRAMAAAFTHLHLVVEPGGAVALAAALWHHPGNGPVIATLSGGNVDPALFRAALADYA